MKHGAHYIVVSPVELMHSTRRVNAPHLACWVVFDKPLIAFDLAGVVGDLQKMGIFQSLSGKMRARIDQRLDLMHK